MIRFRATCAAIAAAAFGAVGPATAQTFVHNTTTPVDASAVTSYQTNFDEVVGMTVTATFADNSTWSGTWGCVGILCGVTNGSTFALGGFASLDTYFFTWGLIAENLTSFTINALPGNGVFDIRAADPVTPGSSKGKRFDYNCAGIFPFCLVGGADHWSTTVTYFNPVTIAGAFPPPKNDAAHDDLWGGMTVAFGKTFNTGDNDECYRRSRTVKDFDGCNYVQYFQDMDNVEGGDFGTPSDVVPEPGSMALLATGLVGILGAGVRRRRRRA